MARAPVSKTGGWGFESLHSCQRAALPRPDPIAINSSSAQARASLIGGSLAGRSASGRPALPRLIADNTKKWGKVVKFMRLKPHPGRGAGFRQDF